MSNDEFGEAETHDMFDIGSLFRTSATLTFVVQIISAVVMLGSLTGYYVGDLIPGLDPDFQVLLFLVASAAAIMVFLAALSVFLRFSRRIGNKVIGPGIEKVRLDSPKVKLVVYAYGILVFIMGIIGVYIWWIVHIRVLTPWIAANGGSILLAIFSYALGAFFIALLIQIIIAGVGRSSTKIIIEVLDADDAEFLE